MNPESNLITQALIVKAWASLLENNPSGAVGASYSLLVGELRNSFEPDAAVIAAIAYFESCHYNEALQSIGFFRRKYDESYRWLYSWRQHEKAGTANPNLYKLLLEGLKAKKPTVPRRIISEWSRSPIFLSWQLELNLYLDEKEKLKKINEQIDDALRSLKKQVPNSVGAEFKNKFKLFAREIPQNENHLISSINHELAFLNRHMTNAWVGAYENGQLVEVEVFNTTGEALLKKSGKNAKDTSNAPQTTKHDSSGMPVLEWGSFSLKNEETSEIWGDEVTFDTDLTSICGKKK